MSEFLCSGIFNIFEMTALATNRLSSSYITTLHIGKLCYQSHKEVEKCISRNLISFQLFQCGHVGYKM